MGYLCKQGINRIIEFGPGRILSGLMKSFDKTVACYQVEDPDSLRPALKEAIDVVKNGKQALLNIQT